MIKGTWVSYFILMLNIIFLVMGQMLFKFGLNKIGGVSILTAWKAVFNPFIFTGLILYVIATLLWFVVLSRLPLAVAYPMQTLAYVLGIIMAVLLFHEQVSLIKWFGMLVIIVGVVLIAWE
nr:EamA family transporter [Paenibacillus pasadenensis]